MEVYNLLRINDWPIRKFIVLVLSSQLSLCGLVAITALGLRIPILREVVGFIFLTFIPGFIILRILKLHNLGAIKSLLFSLGLSLSFLMLLALFMDITYPLVGISEPLSITSLLVTLNVVILLLLVLSCLRDRRFTLSNLRVELSKYINHYTLLSLLLPFLVVFGTYFTNFHDDNSLLLILLPIIATIPVITLKSKKIPEEIYPLVLFVLSVSLLLHNSLASLYIQGRDTHMEYYFANLVLQNSIWDPTISVTQNSLLSIVGVLPVYTRVLGLELTWTFKTIAPLIFSFLPLGMYLIFLKQTGSKISFLSSSVFMFSFPFYFDLLSMVRTQLAMLFTALILLLILDKSLRNEKSLLILFAFGLIASHYGTSYLFGILLVLSPLIVYFLSLLRAQRCYNLSNRENTLSYNFILFYVVVAFAWYMYTAQSSFFTTFVNLSHHIVDSVLTGFSPQSSNVFTTLTSGSLSPLSQVTKCMYYMVYAFIASGLFSVVTNLFSNKRKYNFSIEFLSLSIVAALFLIATIIAPMFLGIPRIQQLTLIILAPFCPIGCVEIYRAITRFSGEITTTREGKTAGMLTFFAIFLIPFLLFNSGFIYELAGSYPNSPSLSQNSIHNQSPQEKYHFYNFYTTHEQDVFCSKWLARNTDFANITIYSSGLSTMTLTSYGMGGVEMSTWAGDTSRSKQLSISTQKFDEGSYIFATYVNTKENLMSERRYRQPIKLYKYSDFKSNLANESRIYDNGASMIYYSGG